MLLADDLTQLLDVLPTFISGPLEKHPRREQLVEIVLDIGRRPEARFAKGTDYLSYRTIVWQDLDYILKRLGKFSGDNRAGIEKTLHRISSIRNRKGNVIGLTCRVGRAIFGTVSIVRDLLEQKKINFAIRAARSRKNNSYPRNCSRLVRWYEKTCNNN